MTKDACKWKLTPWQSGCAAYFHPCRMDETDYPTDNNTLKRFLKFLASKSNCEVVHFYPTPTETHSVRVELNDLLMKKKLAENLHPCWNGGSHNWPGANSISRSQLLHMTPISWVTQATTFTFPSICEWKVHSSSLGLICEPWWVNSAPCTLFTLNKNDLRAWLETKFKAASDTLFHFGICRKHCLHFEESNRIGSTCCDILYRMRSNAHTTAPSCSP